MMYGENIINPDNYAKQILDIEDHTAKYLFAMKQCELLRTNLLENKVSFGFETVASTKEKVDFVRKAIEKGYKVDLLFVSLESPELCYKRVQDRVSRGGHDVERTKVFSRYERTMRFLKDYIELADRAVVYDNSREIPITVFTKKDSDMKILRDPSDIPWVDKYIFAFFPESKRVLDAFSNKP